MKPEEFVGSFLKFISGLLAVLAICLGGFAAWKIAASGFNVDVKTAAEVSACFAITFYCLK
jgi:hypothetical protein